ncbi:2-polyprenyl-3-methyl-5-hydroxy-6-metoxy-1,4-benzoquinol methylase [Rivularia sp. PCC 7116]|uniref:class I SAM-dependent methyltransferase n=1 Tax=Rivularia sp. PCC 7116 TaxID=373994 RepID=UPI00029F0586|nr:class I SAM-dependent methyltransferase [Rivularia sp. PCC 7116]AFY56116.1 2-polyprenyl-3-methyl-5-hydroxy-6-metoxy-1,4-benzoquinol methylase [Rivularia sp. PCC 7116]
MSDLESVSKTVANLYNTYPFPPEPLLDEPPPGYNWRWNWLAAYNFCTGRKPQKQNIRILDAGCGTGVGTEYLVHLNPQATVVGIDLSEGALNVAKERCQRSGANRAEFHHLSLFDVEKIPGEFDLINCVGVLHHTSEPIRGIQALAKKLAPGGLMHIFVYAELGRFEVRLMQQAISLLQGNKRGDYRDGVSVGRKIFDSLPENNRIVKREKERWALENQRDENFADMYVHPQEIDYNIETLFELIDASGLDFVGFSNPNYWNLERLLGKAPELIQRAEQLGERERFRLIELLDPDISHYEFFLSRPPLEKASWADENVILAAIPELNPCIDGFPASSIFNYDYQLIRLSETEIEFMQACNGKSTVREILNHVQLDLEKIKELQKQQLIMLSEQ